MKDIYKKMVASPEEDAWNIIKIKLNSEDVDRIKKFISSIRSSETIKTDATHFVANFLNMDFKSRDELLKFVNTLMKELDNKAEIAFLLGALSIRYYEALSPEGIEKKINTAGIE